MLVKGILTPEDARLAAEHGARGHRRLQPRRPPARHGPVGVDALDPVLDAVGDRLEVLVDGGVRRGTDVLKALALGARAVMVGRPVLWGLAVGGGAGAQRVLEILLAEFDTALALAGSPRAADLNRTLRDRRTLARRAAVRILVTGITGYVGSRLAPRLLRERPRGARVRALAPSVRASGSTP